MNEQTDQERRTRFQEILLDVVERKTLSENDAQVAFRAMMMNDHVRSFDVSLFLTALAARGETLDELLALVTVLRERMVAVDAPPGDTVDLCGTGGDGAGTFNISTAAAFVAAGAGALVAKHGNRAASSRSGSTDVLERLGVHPAETSAGCAALLADAGLVFLSAPRHHPALSRIASARRELGFRTIVNLAGPLANPMRVRRQVVGVARREQMELVAGALKRLGTEHALVVHGDAGSRSLDEITVTGTTHVIEIRAGAMIRYELDPEGFGFRRVKIASLVAAGPEESAAVIRDVLAGKEGAAREVVLLNAGAALYVAGKAPTIRDGVSLAAAAIDDGRAMATLEKLIASGAKNASRVA